MKKQKLWYLCCFVLLSALLSASADCANSSNGSKAKDLIPGSGATGRAWKRAPEKDRIHYCELIAEKLGLGASRWEFFHKSLSATFNTDNTITLGLKLDDTAKAIKDATERRAD